jgi:hypothetical protein
VCINHPNIPDRCIVDPCSYYSNENDCLSNIDKMCFQSESGCRTAKECNDFKNHMEYCGDVAGCAVIGGLKGKLF